MAAIKRLGVGALAGFGIGFLVLGSTARLAMHGIALATGGSQGFSFAGSLEVLFFSALVGLPSGLAFVVLRSRLPRSSMRSGLLLGAGLFVATSALLPARFQSLASSFEGMLWLVFLLFGICFLIHGVCLARAVDAVLSSPS